MRRYDASTAECLVFTYKEGLLSPLAHDLKIRVTRFEIEVDDARAIAARFDPDSLRVECARVDGRDAPGALGERHKREIEGNIRAEVLHPARYPDIRFVSSEVTQGGGEEFQVTGTLTLHGTSSPLRCDVRRHDEAYAAEVRLHQPDFGISPYRAALGTLKVRPDVDVRIEVPPE